MVRHEVLDMKISAMHTISFYPSFLCHRCGCELIGETTYLNEKENRMSFQIQPCEECLANTKSELAGEALALAGQLLPIKGDV